MNIGIIGGGIIGLSSAYYLTKAGHKVTILDKGSFDSGCSFRNAGMIVPSHFIPLAAPGMITKGVRWMFNSESPFYIKPRLDADLLRWGYLFYKSATKEKVARSIPALKELSLLSKSLYQQWAKELPFDFGYQERGLMMLYQTPETEEEEIETAHLAKQYGIEAQVLNPDQVQNLEPEVKVNVRGGVYFPGDAHLIPQVLVSELIQFLKREGVSFVGGLEGLDFHMSGNAIDSVVTTQQNYSFDEVILATGSWTASVGKKLGLKLPMQAGKGYSFTIDPGEKNVRIPSIFVEARVAVTPMGSTLRFGGTMEIAGINSEINLNRVRGIVNSIPTYYPEMKVNFPAKDTIWSGLRPCTPDGLPYVGRVESVQNLVINAGHAMMGLSLGPGSGKLVSQIVAGNTPSMPVPAFDPGRFQ